MNSMKSKRKKLNPKNAMELRSKHLEQFDWIDTQLIADINQTIALIKVGCHDIFTTHRLDMELTLEFRVKITLGVDKVINSQSLPVLLLCQLSPKRQRWDKDSTGTLRLCHICTKETHQKHTLRITQNQQSGFR